MDCQTGCACLTLLVSTFVACLAARHSLHHDLVHVQLRQILQSEHARTCFKDTDRYLAASMQAAQDIKARNGVLVKVPMDETLVRSLNLATTVGIGLFEVRMVFC
jgi:hypothetical protein